MHKNSSHPYPFDSTKQPLIVIIGPTAAGKTDISFSIAQHYDGEIINADIGSFYTPLSIGVAKPDLRQSSVPCHLFNIIDQPQDLNVVTFKRLVFEKINDISSRGKVPIIVGGSHFYVQSLFYTPREVLTSAALPYNQQLRDNAQASLWDQLNSVDPARAASIHPHDTYRLARALQIWHQTGVQPSQLQPEFSCDYPMVVVEINPPTEILKERINLRSMAMLERGGWIDEAAMFIDTPWESFITRKNLIGYTHIFDFLRNNLTRDCLVRQIQQETWHYAKRQKKFIKRFIANLKKEQELKRAPVYLMSEQLSLPDMLTELDKIYSTASASASFESANVSLI